MKKVYLAQTTAILGLAAGLVIAIPTFMLRVGNRHPGVLLVNGRVEGVEVAVGSKLPGRVAKVHIHEGQEIKAGALLAELDAKDYQASYEQAQAQVQQARHNLASCDEAVFRAKEQLAKSQIGLEFVKKQTELTIQQAESAVKEAEAAVDQATALHNKAKTEFDHAQELRKDQVATDMEFTTAREALQAQKAAVQMAQRRLEQAKVASELAKARTSEIRMQEHDLAVMESTVRQATAGVGIAKAQLQAAQSAAKIFEIQLKDTKVFAPCDGMVVTRVVEPGEIVTAGFTVMVLVDFNKLYLKGYLPNNEIGKLKLGDPAKIFLDAYPDKSFDAVVTKVNQQAEFTPKSVDTPQQRVKLVFGVELQVSNESRIFKPGMPADALIKYDPKAEWCLPADLR